jgi:hypothetical protein
MQKFSLVFAAAIVLLTAVAGRAQVAEKKTLTLEGAEKVIAAAKAEACHWVSVTRIPAALLHAGAQRSVVIQLASRMASDIAQSTEFAIK